MALGQIYDLKFAIYTTQSLLVLHYSPHSVKFKKKSFKGIIIAIIPNHKQERSFSESKVFIFCVEFRKLSHLTS